MDNALQALHLRETGQLIHMSGRNQSVFEKLHSAIDALIAELGRDEARVELEGIVEEWEQK